MNQEEILKHIQGLQGNFGQKQDKPEPIPVEKIDEFITKCLERDETLYTLAQALQWKLQRAPMISFPEIEVYPQVLTRLQEKLNNGET